MSRPPYAPPALALVLFFTTTICSAAPRTPAPATKPAPPPATLPSHWQDLPEFRALATQVTAADAALAAASAANAKQLAADGELTRLTKAATDATAEADRLRQGNAPIKDRLDAGSRATAAKKAAEARRASLMAGDTALAKATADRRALDKPVAHAEATLSIQIGEALHEQNVRERLARLALGSHDRPDHGKLEVGQTGPLGAGGNAKITQIQGPHEAIVSITVEGMGTERRTAVAAGAAYSYNEPVVTDRPMTVWLKGIDTSGKVDGFVYHFDGRFKISGTKMYTTPLGSFTVFVLERDED